MAIQIQPADSNTVPAGSSAALIEIVSDVVCPWCFVGKRRLEKALELLGRRDIAVHWKPFELNPDAPPEGFDRQQHRLRKFGSAEYARQLENYVAAAGAEEGILFRFDRILRIPNTFDAHRLICLAGREGRQDAVVEALFRAYFIDGENVGAPEILQRIAAANGVAFDGVAGAEEVRAQERQARAQGVNSVPTFFINRTPIASGAQKPQLLAAVFAPVLGQCPIEGGCA